MSEPLIKHLDVYAFRINRDFKNVAQKTLGHRIPEICRTAILKAVEDETKNRAKRAEARRNKDAAIDRLRAIIHK